MPETVEVNPGSQKAWKQSYWPGLVACLIMAVLASVLLNKSLLPGYTLVPFEIVQDIAPWDSLALGPRANRLIIDPFYYFFPNRQLFTEAIRSGQFMLWNPYMLAGTPSYANPNFQAFYPPNILAALILPTVQALPWLAWSHLILTGSLMYLFLRRHKLHWLACVLGGGIWLLNGYILVWLENPHRLSTLAWIPGIFLAYEAATQEKSPAWAAVGGLFLGLAILGGQVQFVFILGFILGLYTLIKVILVRWSPSWLKEGTEDLQHEKNGEFGRDAIRPIIYLIIIVLIGLGVGALILLPAAEFSMMSHRGFAGVEDILATRWPVQQLISLIAPDFYGNPATEVHYWGAVNYAEVTAYFGIVALLLALTAPLVARPRAFLVYALILVAATLAISLGTVLIRPLLLLPGSQFLALRRTIFLIPLVGSWLAAAGLDGWLEARSSIRRRLWALGLATFVVIVVALWIIRILGESFVQHRMQAMETLLRSAVLIGAAWLLLLSARRWTRAAGLLVILLTVADLLQWGTGFNPITSIEYRYPENAVTTQLLRDSELFRSLPLQSGKLVFGPNLLSQFGIQDITGYTSMIIGDYYQLVESIDPEVEVGWMAANDNMLVMSHTHPLLSLLNVKYVLSSNELDSVGVEWSYLDNKDGVWIYENRDVAPRAFLVHDAQMVGEEQALSAITGSKFDWRQSVILTTELPSDQRRQLVDYPSDSQARVTIDNYSPQQVDITVDTPAAGMLVLTDNYYPGWRATLDGELITIYKANHTLRAVFVPEGEHSIQFLFRPRILQGALVISLTSLTLAGAIIWLDHKRNR